MGRLLQRFLSRFADGFVSVSLLNIRTCSKHRPSVRAWLVISCACVAGSFLPLANAQYGPPRDALTGTTGAPLEEGPRIAVGASVAHDSNFFRDPGIVRSPQSETITTGYAGLLIDKPYAQQRFFLSATATAYRYDKNSYLDFEGFDYRAAWYWHLTPRVSGILSADRTQTPTQFQNTIRPAIRRHDHRQLCVQSRWTALRRLACAPWDLAVESDK